MFRSETQIMNTGVLTWMPVGRQSTATASSVSRSRLNCFLFSTSVNCMSNIISRSTSPKIRTPPFRSASLYSGRGASTSSVSDSPSPPAAYLCACESQQFDTHNSVKPCVQAKPAAKAPTMTCCALSSSTAVPSLRCISSTSSA
jgi:hypothetical protein